MTTQWWNFISDFDLQNYCFWNFIFEIVFYALKFLPFCRADIVI